MPFIGVGMGKLSFQLQVIKVLMLHILIHFHFLRLDILAKACFRLENSSLKQREQDKGSDAQHCFLLLGLLKQNIFFFANWELFVVQ